MLAPMHSCAARLPSSLTAPPPPPVQQRAQQRQRTLPRARSTWRERLAASAASAAGPSSGNASDATSKLNTTSTTSSSTSSSSSTSTTPSTNPTTTTSTTSAAEKKLAELRALQLESHAALARRAAAASSSTSTAAPIDYRATAAAAAPGAAAARVDARMYDRLVTAHNRQSRELRAQEARAAALESEIARCHADLSAALELLGQAERELSAARRQAGAAAAAAEFAVDRSEATARVRKLESRLDATEAAARAAREEFALRVPRRVPISWEGHANEVRLMGSFDEWARGVELSAEDVTGDTVFARFAGAVRLRPGKHLVKLLVDGEWRLAADWPVEHDADGNEVNVLVVD